MRKINTTILWLLVVFSAFCCLSQTRTADVNAVNGVITVDGLLDEAMWQNATKIELSPDDPSVVHPSRPYFDGPSDCRADFAMLWDATGLYVGTWFYDDVHFAPNSANIITATGSYNDDSVEWWVTISWDNAFADPSGPYFGEFGWQLMKGFNAVEDLAGCLLHELGGFSVSDVCTPDDFSLKGFTEKYTSADGVNFQSEALFTWAGDIMTNKGSGYEGDELGFNLGVNDNDLGWGDAEGGMFWTGWTVWQTPDSWGKVTLTGSPAITPKLVSISKIPANEISGIYDIHGRLIQRRDAGKSAKILFYMDKGRNHTRQMFSR